MATSQTEPVHDEQNHLGNNEALLHDPSSVSAHAMTILPPQLPSRILQIIDHELNSTDAPSLADIQAYPTVAYFDHTVIPIIIEGLATVDRERPKKPIEYLAAFFMKNREKFGEHA